MKKEIYYVADDGKKFDTEDECLQYECKEIDIIALNGDGDIIDNRLMYENIDEYFRNAIFMYIKDEKSLKKLEYLADDLYDIPSEIGLYYCDDKDDYYWYELDYKILGLERELKLLKEAKKFIESNI